MAVFAGLLSLTNEWGELRLCNLVPTKAHLQFVLALERMRDSLMRYGHPQPQIVFTDNMSDRAFLEHTLPSLCEGVTPVEKYGHLPPFSIPEDITPKVLYTVFAMEDGACAIINQSTGPPSYVGFDIEWNV